MAPKYEDLTGKTFGKLKVLSRGEDWVSKCTTGRRAFNKKLTWNCVCECGGTTVCSSIHLKRGFTKSCGCYKRERIRAASWKGVGDLSGHFYSAIRSNARDRNLPFEVSIQELWDLFVKQNKKCALSGLSIILVKSHRNTKNGKDIPKQTASLDRIDSFKGYTLDNVQWVHKNVNVMKWAFSQKEFIAICRMVTEIHKEEDCSVEEKFLNEDISFRTSVSKQFKPISLISN